MNILKLTWKNLWHKPWNTILTLLLFSLSVGLISFIFQVNTQIQNQFDKNLAGIDLVIGAKGSPLQLILCNMYHVDVPTGNISIEEAKPFLRPGHPLIESAVPLSLGDSYQGYRIVGTTHDIMGLYNAEVAQGEIWQGAFEVTAGAEVARKLGLKIGSEFNSSHGFVDEASLEHEHHTKFRVVSILGETGSIIDQLLLTNTHSIWDVHDHSETEDHDHDDHDHDDHDHEHAGDHGTDLQDLLNHPEEEITSILVTFKYNNFQTLNMLRNINENTGLQAANPAIEINKLYSQIGAGVTLIKRLGFVIAVVSGLSIFFSLISSLRERRYELALMRVMGSGRSTLFLLIILEGIVLAIIGCVVGLLLSHLASGLFAEMASSEYRYSFDPLVFIKEEYLLAAATVLLGFVAALFPAIQASNTDIHNTLASG